MNNQTPAICSQYDNGSTDFENKVTRTLLKLGIPANTKGFHYIKTAVLIGIENPIGLTSMSKILYPAIASRYYTASIASIEHAIRYAISQSCMRGNPEFICEIFGYTSDLKLYCPTSSEFIAVVSEYIRQNYAETSERLIAS